VGALTSFPHSYETQNYVEQILRAVGSDTLEGGFCNNGRRRDFLGELKSRWENNIKTDMNTAAAVFNTLQPLKLI
jgi:hypothetical protein